MQRHYSSKQATWRTVLNLTTDARLKQALPNNYVQEDIFRFWEYASK